MTEADRPTEKVISGGQARRRGPRVPWRGEGVASTQPSSLPILYSLEPLFTEPLLALDPGRVALPTLLSPAFAALGGPAAPALGLPGRLPGPHHTQVGLTS